MILGVHRLGLPPTVRDPTAKGNKLTTSVSGAFLVLEAIGCVL